MVNNKENSQKNNQKKLNVVFIISIILLGLVPLIWYKPSFMVAGGDVFPLLIGKDVFYKHMFLWGTKNAGVTSDFQQYLMLESIWYFLLLLGFSVGFIQALINIFYFVGAGLSIYYLISIIYEERDSSVLRIGSFIAAVFYMFNFFIMLSNENYAIKWSYVFLPLLLAICVKIVKDIKNNQKPYKNIAYFSIISTILFSFATRNLGILVVDMVAVFLIFLYYFIFEKQTRKGLIKYSIILIIVVFLINMWWVISIFYNYFQPMLSNSLIEGTPTDVTEWSWTHVRSSFLNLFWLNGTWGWYPEYHTYVFKYSNPILLILVFIPVVIAFISLLLSKKIFDYYLAICVLVSFFLSKGIHPPLESINLFLYNHIPFFYVFRTAYGKFELIIVIFLALLICSGVIEAINKLNSSRKTHKIIGKNRIPYLFAVILPLIFIASTFPFITGEVIKDNTKDFPFSSYVVIPSYWRNATSWLSNQTGDFRVLVMPNNDFYLVPYKWGYYGVDTLASDLIQKPTLQVSDDYLINPNYKEIISEVYKVVMDSRVIVNNSNKSFSNNSNESFLLNKNASYSNASNNSNKAFVQLIKVMNVKYILQRNDIWWNFSNRHIIPPQTIRDYLSNNSLINLDKKFGELDIYKLSDEAFVEHIYATDNAIITKNYSDSIKKLGQENLSLKDMTFFVMDSISEKKLTKLILLEGFQSHNKVLLDALNDSSFEKGFWMAKVEDCCNSDPNASKVYASLSRDAYDGAYSLNLTSHFQCACVSQRVKNFERDSLYILKFNYKGDNPKYCVWEQSTEKCRSHEIFNPVKKWNEQIDLFPNFADNSTSVSLFFYANFDGKNITNIYDNVRLYKIKYEPNLTAYKPQVEFEKLSPVRYEVKIKNATQPYFLIFLESYNPNWKAYLSNTSETISWFDSLYKDSVSEDYHFKTNYYANSWHINKTGAYNITLYYKPQSHFYLGLIVSGTIFILCMTYLIYNKKYKEKNQLNFL